MAIKTYKPITPASRFKTNVKYTNLSTKGPNKRLRVGRKRAVGRSWGRISTRHKGGGVKKLYRLIDFKLNKFDVPGTIKSLEYDPNRSGFIALVVYADGDKRYQLASQEMKVGDQIVISERASLKAGNRMALKHIPVGFSVFNIELEPGKGAQLVRSAGAMAQVTAHDPPYVTLKLPSGEVRRFYETCFATIGAVSNPEHGAETIGKAGRSRLLGIRPTVRGSAMNPVDHPHGGGEGRSPIGLKHPKTPWGKPALGVKTRKKGKASDVFIVQRRKK